MSEKKCQQSARKKSRNEDMWKANLNKTARNEGREYISKSNKIVAAKEFTPVQSCCASQCFQRVNVSAQKDFFNKFWKSCGDYKSQNVMLSGLMTIKTPSTENQNKGKLVLWDYRFQFLTFNISVCQKFLCNLLNISRSRFITIQNKIRNNESFQDKRGKHQNHNVLLSENLKNMIREHCLLIPNSKSHYSRESSNLLYFEQPDLTLHTLYTLFVKYYQDKTGDKKCPIKESTYAQYFNHNLNFAFSKPRTDVCNFCFEHRNDKTANIDLQNHKESVEKYNCLKKTALAEQNVLCLEFDFGQNLPLPKLPVAEQFYKRLLWLHVFNVHVYGDHKRSYMYFFTEGNLKKGANTVCNFLLDAIQREFNIDYYNKIHLFSDSCGGQNKNYFFLCFLSLLSRKLQIEIDHLYPVRGHSYCSCDRNFGLYGQKKKALETIETAEDYIKLVQESRNPPFTIIKDSDLIVKNYEMLLPSQVNVPKEVHIRDAVKISYYPNGHVDIMYNYNENPKDYTLSTMIEFDQLLETPIAPQVGISKEKMTDVKALIKYLSPEGQLVFNSLLQETLIRVSPAEKENSIKNPEDCKKKINLEKCVSKMSRKRKNASNENPENNSIKNVSKKSKSVTNETSVKKISKKVRNVSNENSLKTVKNISKTAKNTFNKKSVQKPLKKSSKAGKNK